MLSKVIQEEKVIATLKAIIKAEKIAIVTHKSPDGDAVGASLGLCHFLTGQDKAAIVITPDKAPDYLRFLPGVDDIVVFNDNPEATAALIRDVDLLFCLDFNEWNRTGDMAECLAECKAVKILVDHHLNPTADTSIRISHPEIGSTCELVFRLICRMGYFSEMSLPTANCICAGMLTDTGGLAYNANSPEVYTIMAELLGKGVDKDDLYRRLFNTHSEARMRLMGAFLEKMELIPSSHTAITSFSHAELTSHGYKQGDTEGFVNLPLSIQGIFFSVYISEREGGVKLSFRSQGEFPCNRFATELFGGGGHKNAAGGEYAGSIEEARQRILDALPRYREAIEANAALGF